MSPNSLQQTTRRGFLSWILGICGAITGLAATIPALIYLWPVTKKGPGLGKKVVEGATDLKPWEAKTEILNGKPVIVLRTKDGFLAYSATCTHLGCIVQWNQLKKVFACPCHTATFSVEGKVISGPPPAPLKTYAVSEAGGKVYVSES